MAVARLLNSDSIYRYDNPTATTATRANAISDYSVDTNSLLSLALPGSIRGPLQRLQSPFPLQLSLESLIIDYSKSTLNNSTEVVCRPHRHCPHYRRKERFCFQGILCPTPLKVYSKHAFKCQAKIMRVCCRFSPPYVGTNRNFSQHYDLREICQLA